MSFLYSVCFSLFGAVVLFPPLIYFLKRINNLDIPNNRSSHQVPTPRAGGIVIVAVAVADLCVFDFRLSYLILMILPFAFLGLADDFRRLDAKFRLIFQLLFAIIEVVLAAKNSNPLLGVLAVLFVVSIVNAWNFMDGINGLSAFSCVLTGVFWSRIGYITHFTIVRYIGSILLGVGVGFAIFNAIRPKVFLGDVGAYGLGALISGSIVYIYYFDPSVAVVMAYCLVPAVCDTGFTLVRRLFKGERVLESHHDHVYQKLIDRGYSHLNVALIYSSYVLCCGILSLVFVGMGILYAITGLVFCCLLGVIYLNSPKIFNRMEKTK